MLRTARVLSLGARPPPWVTGPQLSMADVVDAIWRVHSPDEGVEPSGVGASARGEGPSGGGGEAKESKDTEGAAEGGECEGDGESKGEGVGGGGEAKVADGGAGEETRDGETGPPEPSSAEPAPFPARGVPAEAAEVLSSGLVLPEFVEVLARVRSQGREG